MGERSDEIEEQISRTREDLRDNLNELEDRVRGALDWRRQFEERPLTMLAAALGGGMLLAALLPGGGNGRRRRAYAEASRRSEERREARTRKTEPESDGSLDTLKGAFMTVAASRIGGLLGQLLAGYRAETARVKRAQRYSER
jgi:hypothetical protein